MHFSRSVPLVVVERTADVSRVATARSACPVKPGWYALFLKAFGLAALEQPALRRSWLSVPWVRLHEHACSVAAVSVERDIDGEPVVFIFQIKAPEETPLLEIDQRIQRMKESPLHEVAAFRRVIRLARWPRPLRRLVWWLGLRVRGRWRERYFGTFASGNIANIGAEIRYAPTPLTSYFTFGSVSPDGRVSLRLFFDHRVTDAAPAARFLVRLEQALNTEILHELQQLSGEKPLP